jgi:hypothetical protein
MALYAGHLDFTKPLLHEVPALYSTEECAQISASESEYAQAE